ncbi:MAG: hypothetical protein ACR2HJ_00530 [Fimbriimonadales bacterium]
MALDLNEERAPYCALHEQGCFVIPNPLRSPSTSAGFAHSLGRGDNGITIEEALEHVRELSASTALPVNARLREWLRGSPEGVTESVRLLPRPMSRDSNRGWDLS